MGGARTDRAPREAGRWPGDVTQAPGTGSPHKNSRSCISWPRASATERWQPSCSSARGRSTSTCATCSGSLISAPAPSSPVSISTVPASRRCRPGNRRFRRCEPRHPSYGRCRRRWVPPTRAVSECGVKRSGHLRPSAPPSRRRYGAPIGLLHGPFPGRAQLQATRAVQRSPGGLKHRRSVVWPGIKHPTAGAGDVGSLAEERDRCQQGTGAIRCAL